MEKKQLAAKELEENNKIWNFGIRHLQMGCLLLTMVALFVARSGIAVAVLAMTDTKRINDPNVRIYDWDKATQSMILSSFFWGYTLMQVPGGLLAKRFGAKIIVQVALLANAAICALLPTLASTGGWVLVVISRVCMGLTQACLFPSSHTLLGRWIPDHERTTFVGIVYGGSQIGTILGMPLAGIIAQTSLGWPLIFWSTSVVLAMVSLIWHFFTASTPSEHRLITDNEKEYILSNLNSPQSKKLRIPWMSFVRCRGLWAIAAAHFGMGVSFGLFFNELPTYLEKGLNISLKSSALLSALPYLGLWLFSTFSSVISDFMLRRGWLSVIASRKIFNSIHGFGVAIGLLILSYLGPSHAFLALLTVCATLSCMGGMSAGFLVNHLDLSPTYAGVMLSLTNVVSTFGTLITPLVTAMLLNNDPTDITRWRLVFFVTAGISIVCSCIYVVSASTTRQSWDNPDIAVETDIDPEMIMTTKPLKAEKENSSIH